MMRRRSGFDLVIYAILWITFLFGVLLENAWMAAPAAFLILLEHLGDAR